MRAAVSRGGWKTHVKTAPGAAGGALSKLLYKAAAPRPVRIPRRRDRGDREKRCLAPAGEFCWRHSTVKLQRLIVLFYLILFLGVSVFSGVFFVQTREEYRQLKEQEAVSQRRLAAAQAKLQQQQVILERLRTDPAYVEMIIRQKLGYAKPDEFVFRFEN